MRLRQNPGFAAVGLISALGLLGVSPASAAGPASLTLVRDSKPVAAIVVAREPTRITEFAVQELQTHIKLITGTTLPVVNDQTTAKGPRVLVGESVATTKLGLSGDSFQTQEYVIRFLPDTLVLMGKDTRTSDAVTDSPERVPGKFGEALSFDGKEDVITVFDCGFSDDVGTMEAWAWMPAERQETCHGTILRLDGSEPWTYHIIQRNMKSSRITYTTYDGTNCHGLSSGELTEGWHYVAATHDAKEGKMALFVDRVNCGTTHYIKTTCKGAVLGIGGAASPNSGAVGNPFRGTIDEIRISSVIRNINSDASGGPYGPDRDTTLLFHFDETTGPPRDSARAVHSVPPPALFGDNGTLYAVYDFLERFCDVRWYAPTEIGTVCPSATTLVVRGTEVRRSPAMIHRWITPTSLYLPGPADRVPGSDVHLWKLRMRIGGQTFWVCHSFGGYYDRFLAEHPDWFARGYSGRPPQMCYTDPGFVQQIIRDAQDYFDSKGAKPGATARGDVFGLVPMDNSRWCKCPGCQAEMNKAEEKNPQFNNGKASDYVFNFVNKVAREIRKTHPDKWIGALAYSSYAYYPDKVEVEPNVVVQL